MEHKEHRVEILSAEKDIAYNLQMDVGSRWAEGLCSKTESYDFSRCDNVSCPLYKPCYKLNKDKIIELKRHHVERGETLALMAILSSPI